MPDAAARSSAGRITLNLAPADVRRGDQVADLYSTAPVTESTGGDGED